MTDYFHQQLELCKSLPCTLLHVFALKTLQQKSSIPILFNVVRTAEKKSAIQAMRAIQTMPSEFIDTQVSLSLEVNISHVVCDGLYLMLKCEVIFFKDANQKIFAI